MLKEQRTAKLKAINNFSEQYQNKFECVIYKMLITKENQPSLISKQIPICPKLFIKQAQKIFVFFLFIIFLCHNNNLTSKHQNLNKYHLFGIIPDF